jgi:diguanylate cyclase (GGDEF)-like protein
LSRFARHLEESTRRYDLAARFGGEDFALILAGSGLVKSQGLLNRVLTEFKQIEFTSSDGDTTFNVTCSAGLTCFKGTSTLSTEELIKLTDEALYEAKSSGKDQVKVSKLSFVETVPRDTLVHANEKQFLFGGK